MGRCSSVPYHGQQHHHRGVIAVELRGAHNDGLAGADGEGGLQNALVPGLRCEAAFNRNAHCGTPIEAEPLDEQRGCRVSDDQVDVCGVRFYLKDA